MRLSSKTSVFTLMDTEEEGRPFKLILMDSYLSRIKKREMVWVIVIQRVELMSDMVPLRLDLDPLAQYIQPETWKLSTTIKSR